jgi:hypothetical protein
MTVGKDRHRYNTQMIGNDMTFLHALPEGAKPLPLEDLKLAAAKRNERLVQQLYDALTPFVTAYEANALKEDLRFPNAQPKYLAVTMGDIRRAQEAMRK